MATAGAAVLVLAARDVAVAVFALGVAATLVSLAQGRLDRSRLRALGGAGPLAALFLVAVALGTLGRTWSLPVTLLARATAWQTTALAAAASILVNNLPAAALLSAHASAHPRALLVGLDVGPNLAVTAALSGLLWLRVTRAAGSRPSALRFSLIGAATALPATAAALLGLALSAGFRL